MADYVFYTATYLGNSIPESDFPAMAARAGEQLAKYDRVYQVQGSQEDRDMAVCAMADVLYYYETAENGGLVTSSSVGSVSSSVQFPALDFSRKAKSAELYRCASRYLSIYRGLRG